MLNIKCNISAIYGFHKIMFYLNEEISAKAELYKEPEHHSSEDKLKNVGNTTDTNIRPILNL